MKTTKTSTTFLTIAALFALGVAAAYAQETVNVKMTFSGTAVDNTVVSIQSGTSEDEDTFAGTGTLGPFTLHNVRAISNDGPQTANCDLYLTEPAASGVLRLQDGSLLYLQLTPGTQGSDCIHFTTGKANCELTFTIVGGTGRFKGASGTLNFTETVMITLLSDSLGNPIELAATGELTGTISGISAEYEPGGGN